MKIKEIIAGELLRRTSDIYPLVSRYMTIYPHPSFSPHKDNQRKIFSIKP